MGKQITDNEIIKHKKAAIKSLNDLFEALINSPNPKHKKKADLVAYWIETYAKYLLMEERFDYLSVPRFKRGDVIQVNFGFNIGSEHGGLHYAIVLDNDNKQLSPVITVIPLSSGDIGNTYGRDVFLGNELYDKLNSKYNKLIDIVESELQDVNKVFEILDKTIEIGGATGKELPEEIELRLDSLKRRVDMLLKEKKTLETYAKDISKLKMGSIALMEQITTVSKMRIYKPKNSNDLLHGIRFSDGAMDKMNERILELYVHNKKS